MGGQKAVSIGQFPILSLYHQEFRNMPMQPGARLWSISYSCSDATSMTIKKSDLKIFLVDPAGYKILNKRDRGGR
jgi:hypothetical protein